MLLHVEGNENGYYIDDEYIHVGYRRPEIDTDLVHHDDGLSDYVLFRLWLARQLALLAAEKTWG